MAMPDRETTDHLIAQIASEPHAYDFFQAVRLLEATCLDKPRVGFSQRLGDDIVRFTQNPSLSFASSTLAAADSLTGAARLRLAVNFFGLFGPNGPLPQHLTDYARDRQRNAHDPTLVRFADIFHHRMVSFFFRAWASNRKNVDFDRPEEARFARFIGSLFGIGMPTLRNRDSIPDVAKIFFAGRLVAQTRNAEGLEAILETFLGLPTEVQEFADYWLRIPHEDQCRLGESLATGSLGVSTVVGERKYESQLKFRIRLGPMELVDLKRLLPLGASFRRLKDWILNYSNKELLWDLQCVLRARAVPGTCLGREAALGWVTWLKSKPFLQDADDPIFDPERYG
jgi:type VI secretion system protein ImpH